MFVSGNVLPVHRNQRRVCAADVGTWLVGLGWAEGGELQCVTVSVKDSEWSNRLDTFGANFVLTLTALLTIPCCRLAASVMFGSRYVLGASS